ncbi:MAG: transposase [Acidobacteria bacterium]|nr:transposase [Acidobacteriota bacterium]
MLCDNARFHRAATCRPVRAYLQQWGHRIRLHYLPKYAPDTNPIERVWWHLHEEITRNHRCQDLEELLELVFAWLDHRMPFGIESSIFAAPTAASSTFPIGGSYLVPLGDQLYAGTG